MKILIHWGMLDFQILIYFIIQYQKVPFVNITRNLLRIILKYCKTVHLQVYEFSKIFVFALKALILSLATNTNIFLEMTAQFD